MKKIILVLVMAVIVFCQENTLTRPQIISKGDTTLISTFRKDTISFYVSVFGIIDLDSTFMFKDFRYYRKSHQGYISTSKENTTIDTMLVLTYKEDIIKYLKTIRYAPILKEGVPIKGNWFFTFH